MVISDTLMDEVLQILVTLPFRTVSTTIGKIQAELAVQQQALQPNGPNTESVKDVHDRLRREGKIGAVSSAPF